MNESESCERQGSRYMRPPTGRALFRSAILVLLLAGPDGPPALQAQQAKAGASAPPLAASGIDIQQTSVSGVSSGGAMALQMHVAHSSIMRGAGIVAGVAYDCADSSLPVVGARLLRGIDLCLPGSVDATFSIGRTAAAAAIPGAIDDPSNLFRQKVWLFSGYNDGSVLRPAMNAVAAYYEHYVDPHNVFYKTNNHAPHALVTDDYGGQCLAVNEEYVNDCQYDMAGNLLKHIYGHLENPSSSGLTASILAFDQHEFVKGDPHAIGLASTGYVYVPAACKAVGCRVHVVFHGCKQYAGRVGDAVYRHGGYNRWADTNKIVVLYPQTEPMTGLNPNGCWDWWGLSDIIQPNNNYARKTGHQISAIKAMLDRLAQGFVPNGTSDTFGTPQNFLVQDSTPSALALLWQPNLAAAGFNLYRASGSTGPFNRINSQPVAGASFVDRPLQPQTTYHYQIRAVDQAGQESSPTTAISATTPAVPATCEPYFSDNITHVKKLRAYWNPLDNTVRAIGSNDRMGRYSLDDYSHLLRQGSLGYRVGYCP